VKLHGIVLESAHVRGARVPTFADAVVGAPVRGNWWSHPEGKTIFSLTRAVRDSGDVLICRLIDGKITYVHRRLWPAVVRIAPETDTRRFDAIQETHTPNGRHVMRVRKFPAWVPPAIKRAAKRLSIESAHRAMRPCLQPARKPADDRED
jgi:hypothetical protein